MGPLHQPLPKVGEHSPGQEVGSQEQELLEGWAGLRPRDASLERALSSLYRLETDGSGQLRTLQADSPPTGMRAPPARFSCQPPPVILLVSPTSLPFGQATALPSTHP